MFLFWFYFIHNGDEIILKMRKDINMKHSTKPLKRDGVTTLIVNWPRGAVRLKVKPIKKKLFLVKNSSDLGWTPNIPGWLVSHLSRPLPYREAGSP